MSLYSISDYGRMLADEIRVGAYAEALRRCVTTESVVLDLGTGIGFFAVLAARLGARRVYGVDLSESIEVAREIAARNGVADRVEFLRADSMEIELPERADLMVCDVRGALPWAFGSVPPLIDARRRHLTEAAMIVPSRDRLFVAVVEEADEYAEQTGIWRQRPCGVDIEAGRDLVVNQRSRSKMSAEQLLTGPGLVAILDYRKVDSPNMSGNARLAVTRRGVGHGLAVWFDAEIADGIGFSNRPGEPKLIYGQMLFPWPEPVELEPGEQVEVSLRADYVNGEYVWTWDTRVLGREDEERERFHQSNFFGVFPSKETRRARSSTHRPGLSERGRAAEVALGRMGEDSSLEQIAQLLVEQFPELFAGVGEAQGFAGDLAVRYGRTDS